MIKYASIKGYKNIGEVQFLSHIYQFIEEGCEEPKIILIHAYECSTKIFKGYLFNETKIYESIPLELEEQETIEKYTGKSTQVDFEEFIKGTILFDTCQEFKARKKVTK